MDAPDFQLAVGRRNEGKDKAARVFKARQANVFHGAEMPPVHALRNPQKRGQNADFAALLAAEFGKIRVLLFRKTFAVVKRDIGDNVQFRIVKAEQVGVADKVIGVFLVVRVREERADVVRNGGVIQQFAGVLVVLVFA